MKRTLSSLLIVCTLMQGAVPVIAQPAAEISITAMDRAFVRPFDRLVISGTGFVPASSAISVLFVPKQRGLPIVIPVFSATSTRLEVIVPAFLDASAGDFGFGQVDVQVVQVTRDQVMSSNVLGGLDVAPVPALLESVGAGRVTRAFMQLSAELLSAGGGAFDAFKNEQSALLAEVERVVANPRSTSGARTLDSSAFVVDATTLKASDRLIAAYLTSIAPLIARQRVNDRAAHPLVSANCAVDTGMASLDEVICDTRVAIVGGSRNWITGVAVVGAGLAVFVALTATGPLMMGLGAAAGAGLFLTAASQLAYVSLSPTVAPSLLTGDAPPMMETLRDHGRPMLQSASDIAAAPVTTAATAAADVIAAVAAQRRQTESPAPKGGTVAGAPRIDPAAAMREMISFQGGANAVVTSRINVPSSKSTKTLSEARIAPRAASAYDGAYSGTMAWSRTDGEDTWGGVELVRFTVAGGSVTVTAPYGGTGTINASGRVSGLSGVTPAGFTCTFGGIVEVSAARTAAGGGTLGCVPKDGAFTSGVWSATRPATP